MNMSKLVVGFITYGKATAKYLPYFLPSLKEQSFADFSIFAIDNTEEEKNENRDFIKSNFSDIEFEWVGNNIGFARAYNRMINKAIKDGAEYFLAINPDMIFDEEMIGRLMDEIKKDEKIGAVAPKILRWDFSQLSIKKEEIERSKTDVIDSCGIFITKEHRFSDCDQGKVDDGRMEVKEVFGFSGAAVLFNLKALEDVAYDKQSNPPNPLLERGQSKEFFDELMFMYKEDCDLSYRLRLAGWKIKLAPSAVAYHHRAVSPKGESNLKIALNRFRKNKQNKKWSFLNHWIMFSKFKNLHYSWKVDFATAFYQFKKITFILLFEQYLFLEFLKLQKLKNEIRKREGQLKVRVDMEEMERWMR